ncbi:hypothetical protein Pla175_31990 [Pirellulimonas nuda]|uniref:YwiC-like protein n=1 Tax=Pirellulimonas nuda TaxID=2528009 RepID=A0A518DEB1_9BACT|nr:YwiC-like family protein [Pirellulimonas nuda]QDU89803.1 hypothetical protein Pla175_31990 [Pirellulimonas nuda]
MSATSVSHSLLSVPPIPRAKLEPREHGAYAILGIPLLTSIWMAGLSIEGACVALASAAGFLAHEPLLVAWGRRGQRAQQAAPAARRRLLLLLTAASACGSVALLQGSPATRVAMLGCLLLAASGLALAAAGGHRTQGARLWCVAGLSAPCVPILLSGDWSISQSIATWAAWLIGFAATTVAMGSVLAQKKTRSRAARGAWIVALAGLAAGLTLAGRTPAVVSAPMLGVSAWLVFWPPPAQQIKRIGWALVAATVATAAGMIAIA